MLLCNLRDCKTIYNENILIYIMAQIVLKLELYGKQTIISKVDNFVGDDVYQYVIFNTKWINVLIQLYTIYGLFQAARQWLKKFK
jgi:hypothetical protein